MTSNDTLNFVYIFNTRFMYPSLVSIFSLLKTNPQTKFSFHLIISDLNTEELAQLHLELNKLKAKFSNYVATKLYSYTTEQIRELLRGFRLGRFHPLNAIRVLLPNILAPEIKSIVYVDGDIMFLKELEDITNDLMSKNEFCAAPDVNAVPQIRNIQKTHPSLNYDPKENRYFNAGFVLWNLELARKNKRAEELSQILSNYDMNFLDQCALNVVYQNNFYELHPKYNSCVPYKWEIAYRSLSQDVRKFDEAYEDPRVFHFNGLKPWDNKCRYNRRFNEPFWEYIKEAGYEEKIKRPTGLLAFIIRSRVHINSFVAYKDPNLKKEEYSKNILRAFKISPLLGFKVLWRSIRYSF